MIFFKKEKNFDSFKVLSKGGNPLMLKLPNQFFLSFNPNQCDVWEALPGAGGGAPGAPPIYLGSGAKFSPKIMFPWKVPSIPTHLTLFQNFFSITPPKNSENWNYTEKSLKMVKIFKICNFWAISTCNTSKKRIFHIEFIFKQKKYGLFEKKAKNLNFFNFFFKIYTDQLASIANFSNLW